MTPRQMVVRHGLRLLLGLHALALAAARFIGGPPRRPRRGDGYRVLLTGTFHADNWIAAHALPIATCERCRSLTIVASSALPPLEGVRAIYPPRLLCRIVGEVPARLLTFAWVAVRTRPHIVGGFHLLLNGLAAALVARLVGARSLYYCVGGPNELLDGGIHAENRLFGLLDAPDPVIERRLVRAVKAFDLIATMGSRAADFFRRRGVASSYHVLSGGIDTGRFARKADAPSVARGPETQVDGDPAPSDLILVGRLVPVKRIDIFLRAVARVARQLPDVRATILGDGPLRASLERLARELGIDGRVRFAGHRKDVERWLSLAKVFVLTSDSEGLPLSAMEALMCGAPAVVSHVGELADLVEDGVNGFLVESRDPADFADRIAQVLDPARWPHFSEAARRTARRHDVAAATRGFDAVLLAR